MTQKHTFTGLLRSHNNGQHLSVQFPNPDILAQAVTAFYAQHAPIQDRTPVRITIEIIKPPIPIQRKPQPPTPPLPLPIQTI